MSQKSSSSFFDSVNEVIEAMQECLLTERSFFQDGIQKLIKAQII